MHKRFLFTFFVVLAITLILLGGVSPSQAAHFSYTGPAPQTADQAPTPTPTLDLPIQPNSIAEVADIVNPDDVIITGSMCVGFDCLIDGTENFGFDTVKLKENNLQVLFDDTSLTAGFPANDWRLVINDTYSGGANYFSLQDATGAAIPFKVMAGAPTNTVYLAATGYVGLGTANPTERLHVNGNILANGYVQELSDRNAKTGFAPVDGAAVLNRLAQLPVTSWSYKSEMGVRHIGPVAQDFYNAFGLGQDDTHLAALDVNGVSLAAIQALDQQVKAKEVRIADLEGKLNSLEARLSAIETRSVPGGLSAGWLLGLVGGVAVGLAAGWLLAQSRVVRSNRN